VDIAIMAKAGDIISPEVASATSQADFETPHPG
jgi:hypothetical protein